MQGGRVLALDGEGSDAPGPIAGKAGPDAGKDVRNAHRLECTPMNEEVRSAIIDAILLAAPIAAGMLVCHMASWAYGLGCAAAVVSGGC